MFNKAEIEILEFDIDVATDIISASGGWEEIEDPEAAE